VTVFPDDFPTTPPAATQPIEREAEQAVREVEGAKVIVLPDHGTSLVHWAVLLRHPASTPAGKEGVAELTASLLGAQVHRDVFDPRPRKRELLLAGVQLAAMARENFTLIRSSAEREKMTEGLEATRRLLREPDFLQGDFREEPFAGAKQKLISEIELSDAEPAKMASRELIAAVKGISPRLPTTRSVAGLTLGDVRGFYQQAYGPTGATLIIAGNVTAESGEEIAHQLLDGWSAQSASPRFARQPIHAATTAAATAPDRRMPIIVVDRPGAVQCTVRLAAPAYDAESTERFAGTLAGEILGEGVQSRLGKFVRTEHGYAYTVTARFLPMHDEGYFVASCDTEPATLAGTMTTVLEQIARMRDEFVSDAELADAKASLARRSLVREEGASQRLESRLARELTMTAGEKGDDEMRGSGYDSRVQGVSASEVRAVMQKYVQPGRMSVVVVGPASAVAETLRPFGEVRVVR
jgi:zinc protease